MSQVKYKRIILKVSGEALAGEKGTGINPEVIKHLAEEIKSVHDMGVEIGIVCTRVGTPKFSNPSCNARPFIIVASIPI